MRQQRDRLTALVTLEREASERCRDATTAQQAASNATQAETTARDTLAWFKAQSPERQSKLKAGLTQEREAEVLAQWHKQHG